MCLNSVKRYHPERNIILLDENNISEFIEIPDYILHKYKTGIISHAHFSDYIRVCVLAKYGGTWIDSTILLTDKIPSIILSANVFMFRFLNASNTPILQEEYLEPQVKNQKKRINFASNFFLHTNISSYILSSMKQLLEFYWLKENIAIDYFFFHHFLDLSIFHSNKCRHEFNEIPIIYNTKTFSLKKQLLQTFNLDLYEKITSLSSIHKLSYKKMSNDLVECSLHKVLMSSYSKERIFDNNLIKINARKLLNEKLNLQLKRAKKRNMVTQKAIRTMYVELVNTIASSPLADKVSFENILEEAELTNTSTGATPEQAPQKITPAQILESFQKNVQALEKYMSTLPIKDNSEGK